MYIYSVKYYADTPNGEKNKYFCFQSPLPSFETRDFGNVDCSQYLSILIMRGFKVRAFWYEVKDYHLKNGVERIISSTRIK